MSSLTSLTAIQLLDAFAANDPLPAGGSAAALVGAVGTSLLMMVATLPRTRSGAVEETTVLAEAAVRLRPVRDELAALVDRDSESYAALLAAIRAPRGTEAERTRRHEDIVAATRIATEVPLATMRASAAALETALIVAENGSRAASGDVAAAIELLLGAVRAAGRSVAANLSALKDAEYVQRLDEERRRLEAGSNADAERVRDALVE
jgi:glutamate formiminotransferase/formiminotetrahydrofolate cyclodeaminase